MLNVVKIISTEFDKAKRRIVKFLRYGKSDVQTSAEASPFGIDSNPVKDMIAVYSQTGTKGETVIIGYIDKNKLADVGELRLYSTDSNGNLKAYTWLKKDGTIEIGGNTDFMVRYSKLEEAFNELKGKFNTFASTYVPGGPSTQGMPATITQSNADISQAKINEIKTL